MTPHFLHAMSNLFQEICNLWGVHSRSFQSVPMSTSSGGLHDLGTSTNVGAPPPVCSGQ